MSGPSNLIPVFTLKLNHKILPRLVTVGKYDGERPCLTAATNGNKVIIHNPHRQSVAGTSSSSRVIPSFESDISLLTIGQHITSLSAGSLDLSNPSDVLLVGTHTHVLAYDVERNIELFHNEVPDGANSIIIGSHLSSGQQLAYVGGNCSIVGFDKDGQDAFWTVTGDNVHSLALVDYDLDGSRELLVGSEDYDIRVFREDELMHEVSEVDTVISMCSLGHNRFGYALTNGIVGVYTGSQKTWSAKSKHFPLMLLSQDINDDGVNELITAWSNGRVDVRHPTTGQVLYKDVFPSAVAGIVKADYRMTGKEELICCSIDGEVRGYSPSSAPPAHSHQLHGNSLLQELHQKKSRLLTELKNYEMTKHISESRDPHTELSRMGSSSSFVGLIPANTQIQTQFTTRTGTDKIQPHIALVVKTTNNTPIRAVVVFSDGLFDGESFIVHPPVDTVTDQVEVPLFPDKDVSYELDIRIFVGQPNSTQYHVFKISRTLVKFALYVPCALDNEPRPTSSVVFQINERIDRVKSFLQSNFLYGLSSDLTVTQSTYLEVAYISLRTNSPIFIKMELDKDNQVSINTDDMDLAGDIIQSMAEAFNIETLSSVADFPKHMEDLKEILTKLGELRKVREALTAEIADHSSIIRNLVVRAEDARLMDEMKSMKMAYMQLYDLNKEILKGYEIRRNNHLELLDYLKIVNQAVQKGSRLRVGKYKTKCTASCRAAIKTMDHDGLIKAILTGSS